MTTNFWNSGKAEPKRNYRFLVTIGATTDDMAGAQWWAKTVDTPSFDVTEVEHNYYDNKYYYPGRVQWNEISMTVVDPKGVDVAWRINSVLNKAGYNVKTNAEDKVSMSKQSSTEALGGLSRVLTVTVYDDEGNEVEEWSLKNFWLKSAKFGTLDYSNDDLKQADLTFRYDWATITGNTSDISTHTELHGTAVAAAATTATE